MSRNINNKSFVISESCQCIDGIHILDIGPKYICVSHVSSIKTNYDIPDLFLLNLLKSLRATLLYSSFIILEPNNPYFNIYATLLFMLFDI